MSIVNDFRAIKEAVEKKPLPEKGVDDGFYHYKIKLKRPMIYCTNLATGEISVTTGFVALGWVFCDENGVPLPATPSVQTTSTITAGNIPTTQPATAISPYISYKEAAARIWNSAHPNVKKTP